MAGESFPHLVRIWEGQVIWYLGHEPATGGSFWCLGLEPATGGSFGTASQKDVAFGPADRNAIKGCCHT